MALTAKLGTFLSQPGLISLGAPANTDYVAWQGPFSPAEMYQGSTFTDVATLAAASNPVSVTPTVASQIALSDPTWWAQA